MRASGRTTVWDDLQAVRRYSPVRAYNASKLANLLFGLELDRCSRAGVWGITSNVAHPGTTLTNLYSSGPNSGRERSSPQQAIMARLPRWGVFVQDVRAGLLPALYAATSPDADGGRFYGPDGLGQFTGGPPSCRSTDPHGTPTTRRGSGRCPSSWRR
jgi:NAD(P)-dependent dehydrogenase (short-subunit alcohol dehydrogenase family)